MSATKLFISRDADCDWLTAIEYGRAVDGQPEDWTVEIGDSFRWVLDGPRGDVVGFEVLELRDFDAEAPAYAELWTPPRFDAPVLGLSEALAGEIVLCVQARFYERSTVDRFFFDHAVDAEGDEAVGWWIGGLESGDMLAMFGLGYSLHDVGRFDEAYTYLRRYAEIVPFNSWAWCWLGRACTGLGLRTEAEAAFRRAIELEEAGGFETDAPELLEELEGEPSR